MIKSNNKKYDFYCEEVMTGKTKVKTLYESDNVIAFYHTKLLTDPCGCTFLVRWLGETKRKIHKLILVTPWKMKDNIDDFVKAFYVFPIDKTIKDRVDEVIMFTADNEAEDGDRRISGVN